MACTEGLGCTECVVGHTTCDGNVAHICNGAGFVDVLCDPLQGLSCDPTVLGGCVGACAPSSLGTSYIGCDYYPTVTGNTTGTAFDFAVAIANTTNSDATVTIDGGALSASQTVVVSSNRVVVQTLPWVPTLKLCNSTRTDGCSRFTMLPEVSALAAKGSYHLRSTQPVTVYQFNPLQYTNGETFSYSNDASLLFPANTWRTRYYTAGWEAYANYLYPSLFAVTASHDNTHVTITTKAATGAGQGAPAFAANTAQTLSLDAGDVIELGSTSGDLTGSLVESDKPVQVISGHYCTNVPTELTACDHLEESMVPVDALGERYIVSAPAVTTIPTGKVEIIRVIATSANTNLTYDPPQPGAPTNIVQAGGFVEIRDNANSFEIKADQKVMVVQYMEGESAGGATGDPAMTLAVPVEQFRTRYLFHAPTNYDSNYVDVVAPAGANIKLDGVPLVFVPIGTTGYALSRVYPLGAGPNNDGTHSIQGDMAFGITVYGYGQYTSYWYPGGLELDTIIL